MNGCGVGCVVVIVVLAVYCLFVLGVVYCLFGVELEC